MREAFLFGRLEKTREKLLKEAESCPADKRNVVPAGFNNSILWHLGHVLTVTDGILNGFTGGQSGLPANYRAFFGNGTKPADWTSEAPSWETVVGQLREQPKKISEQFAGKLQEPVQENFFQATTVEELLHSVLMHESGHSGNVGSMLKLLK